MSVELKIPEVGESIQEVQVGRWLKKEGDSVRRDEEIVELETDKASMELPAPVDGVLAEIVTQEGEIVSIGDVIARIEKTNKKENQTTAEQKKESKPAADGESKTNRKQPATKRADDESETTDKERDADKGSSDEKLEQAEPNAKKPQREPADTKPKKSTTRSISGKQKADDESTEPAKKSAETSRDRKDAERQTAGDDESELESTVPMSLIRRRIAERLVEAQQTAALLTTFNEIDMLAVVELRARYRERFKEEYGVKLGYMSFFVKAAIDALKRFPAINAEVRDETIVYRDYYHVGVAIGGGKGLVVPTLRFAERMSFAEIEKAISDFARRAESNRLEPNELEGGTFTITNGGVYGSLLSTPIVNPPQSGVFAMHAIQDRPVVCQGEIVVRPMMYVALTYDHRVVDGREAASFLKRIKETIEEPARMLFEA